MPKFECPTDSERNKINLGDLVAFNRSGFVLKGRVVGIKPRIDRIARRSSRYEWGSSLQWVIKIVANDTRISEVKNTDGILVIG